MQKLRKASAPIVVVSFFLFFLVLLATKSDPACFPLALIPILLAATLLGAKGGIASSLIAAAVVSLMITKEQDLPWPSGYIPHLIMGFLVYVLSGLFAGLWSTTERRRAEAEQKRRRLAETWREISAALSSSVELREVLDIILEQLGKLVDYDSAAIMLLLDGAFKVVAGRGFPNLERTLQLSFPLAEDALGRRILETKRPLVLRDAQRDKRYLRAGGTDYVHAWMGIPLVVKDEVIGLLTIDNKRADVYTKEAAQMAQAFANQAAIAIENARLYLAQKEEAEISETLLQVAAAISGLTDLDKLLKTTLQQVVELLNADRSIAWLWDEEQKVFYPREVYGFSEPMILSLKALRLSPNEVPILGELLHRKEPLAVEDALHTTLIPQELVEAFDIRSILGVPMIYQERLLGALGLSYVREVHHFTEKEITVAIGIANQAAIAIQNARLFEQAQQEIAERKRVEEELRQSYLQLQRTLEGTIHTLTSAVEMKDPYTAGHQQGVARLACAIAKEMGLPEEQIEGIRIAGLIHDIGKITVPAEILSRPGPLNDLEYGIVKTHAQAGYEILNGPIELPWPVAQIVLQHHERMDGSGYPQGLSGEEILLEARILAVADVVEAMASDRPYRSARGIDKALEEISRNKGVLYDPEVVDACLKLFTEKKFTLE